jgi:hypothetical protein
MGMVLGVAEKQFRRAIYKKIQSNYKSSDMCHVFEK